MKQSDYNKKYNNFPWWSNFIVTLILYYPFIIFILGFGILQYWWIHAIALTVAFIGIWFWNPITRFFKNTVE